MTQLPIGSAARASLIPARELTFLYDSQDLDALLEHIGTATLAAQGFTPGDVTAAMVEVGEGEYAQVWLTDTSRPYAASAEFVRVA